MAIPKDDDIMEVYEGGGIKKMRRDEWEKWMAEENGAIFLNHKIIGTKPVSGKPKAEVPLPDGYEIITFSNVGDKIEEAIKLIAITPGGLPTPEAAGLDNTVIGPDGITNYGWVMREAHRILGYISVAEGAMC